MQAFLALVALALLARDPFARLFSAQLLGTVTGVVREATSGTPLPGVTVEVTNPALIEKARSVVTDSAGAYAVADLPAGTYTVTFGLSGFNTLHREGVDVAAGITTRVDGALKVWSISEMVTGQRTTPQYPPPTQTVICGTTVVQGDATIDPKLTQHQPATAPKPSVRIMPVPACQR